MKCRRGDYCEIRPIKLLQNINHQNTLMIYRRSHLKNCRILFVLEIYIIESYTLIIKSGILKMISVSLEYLKNQNLETQGLLNDVTRCNNKSSIAI